MKILNYFFIGLIYVIFFPALVWEYLTTSKEDREFIKKHEKRQKELSENIYRLTLYPTPEMNMGEFCYIEKIKGHEEAESYKNLIVEPFETEDYANNFGVFYYGVKKEEKIIIDFILLSKINEKNKNV